MSNNEVLTKDQHSQNSTDTYSVSEDNGRSKGSKLPIPITTTRLPNSTALEKSYKSALKEVGKLKSAVAPNLGLKRTFSQSTINTT